MLGVIGELIHSFVIGTTMIKLEGFREYVKKLKTRGANILNLIPTTLIFFSEEYEILIISSMSYFTS